MKCTNINVQTNLNYNYYYHHHYLIIIDTHLNKIKIHYYDTLV